MAEPPDQMPAAVGRGHLRASHAGREQVIGTLKAAFIQGRLTKGGLPQAELRTLKNEGHNSIAGHLPEIINTLIATGQPAQNRST
jgi:hypothetical protein